MRDETMLSVEGVTHAPIDVGVQAVFEAPFGLRLTGGYGWVPGAYTRVLTGVAANASNDAVTELVLSRASYRGNTWRVQLGVRPFRRVGLYLDAGYSHLRVDSALDLADTGAAQAFGLTGGYAGTLLVDLWLVELGYQAQIARRVVWGVAVGALGTLDARTTISATGGAHDGPELAETEELVDRALEAYGVVPTLTLRLGLDLI